MTQETLDMVVHAYCEGCQEFIGDYEVKVTNQDSVYLKISVLHHNIKDVLMPYYYVGTTLSPKAKSEIIIELVKQIIEFGDEWLRDEQDYEADKAAEKWDNDRKSNLEY